MAAGRGFHPKLVEWLEANGIDHNKMPMWERIELSQFGSDIFAPLTRKFVNFRVFKEPTMDWLHCSDVVTEDQEVEYTVMPDEDVRMIIDHHNRSCATERERQLVRESADRFLIAIRDAVVSRLMEENVTLRAENVRLTNLLDQANAEIRRLETVKITIVGEPSA